jgi:acetyl-CoA carboxylase carboxyltransferase component
LQQMEEVAVQKQHAKLKLTARERLNILFDEGSFFELNTFVEPAKEIKKSQNAYGDGVVVGRGLIQGRSVFAYAQILP